MNDNKTFDRFPVVNENELQKINGGVIMLGPTIWKYLIQPWLRF